jgi:2-polyprenyl-3-methyl-5-hydroxy-6-metoxy-1,4-benzoquinol methylase
LKINRLTEKDHWEHRWERIKLPAEIRWDTANPLAKEILKVFDIYLPHSPGLSIIEIGGAPGHFLAYFAKHFGYSASALDYSDIGCAKMQESFDMMNLGITIYNRDIFSDLSDLPCFDIVFSTGFIEHFSNLESVVGKHVALLKNGGILVLGMPNFRGITQFVLKRLTPRLLSMHNLEAMDIRNWESFENKYGLETIFKGYIGGFEPRNFRRCENRTLKNQLIRLFFKPIRILITDRFQFLRRFNSIYWSAYLFGVYKNV